MPKKDESLGKWIIVIEDEAGNELRRMEYQTEEEAVADHREKFITMMLSK